MWSSIKQAYADSARIIAALPLLFALPLVAELIQHVIEYRADMYANFSAMAAASDDPARMGFGQVKILTLTLLLYWVIRWHAFRSRSDHSVFGDRSSALLFFRVVLYGTAVGIVQQFGGTWLSPVVPDEGTLMAIGIAFFVFSIVLDLYLSCWKVGSALGNQRLTIPVSFRIMHRNFWWSFAFSIVMILPLMTAHYALAVLAVGRPDPFLWTILTIDGLVVGYLGLVLATTSYLIARRAAERASVPLVDAPVPD